MIGFLIGLGLLRAQPAVASRAALLAEDGGALLLETGGTLLMEG